MIMRKLLIVLAFILCLALQPTSAGAQDVMSIITDQVCLESGEVRPFTTLTIKVDTDQPTYVYASTSNDFSTAEQIDFHPRGGGWRTFILRGYKVDQPKVYVWLIDEYGEQVGYGVTDGEFKISPIYRISLPIVMNQ